MPNIALIQSTSEIEPIKQALSNFKEKFEFHNFDQICKFIEEYKEPNLAGIIISFKTLIPANRMEKQVMYELAAAFPLLKLRIGEQPPGITGVIGNKNLIGSELLDNYFSKIVEPFDPRPLRKEVRKKKLFNIQIFSKTADEKKIIHAVTLNISMGGLFAVTSEAPLSTDVIILIKEAPEKVMFKAKVSWKLLWGNVPVQLPGIGFQFVSLGHTEKEILKSIL